MTEPAPSPNSPLLPCPFCGGPARIEHSYHEDEDWNPRDFWHARVVCTECDFAKTEWWAYGQQEVKEPDPEARQYYVEHLTTKWNRRPAIATLTAERDDARRALDRAEELGRAADDTANERIAELAAERDEARARAEKIKPDYEAAFDRGLRAGNEQSIAQQKAVLAALAEVKRLSAALMEIDDSYCPSQPGSSAATEYQWALRWIGHLRGIASAALAPKGAPDGSDNH